MLSSFPLRREAPPVQLQTAPENMLFGTAHVLAKDPGVRGLLVCQGRVTKPQQAALTLWSAQHRKVGSPAQSHQGRLSMGIGAAPARVMARGRNGLQEFHALATMPRPRALSRCLRLRAREVTRALLLRVTSNQGGGQTHVLVSKRKRLPVSCRSGRGQRLSPRSRCSLPFLFFDRWWHPVAEN